MQEAHKSLILVKAQGKQCGKELVDNIKFSEEVFELFRPPTLPVCSLLQSAISTDYIPVFHPSVCYTHASIWPLSFRQGVVNLTHLTKHIHKLYSTCQSWPKAILLMLHTSEQQSVVYWTCCF